MVSQERKVTGNILRLAWNKISLQCLRAYVWSPFKTGSKGKAIQEFWKKLSHHGMWVITTCSTDMVSVWKILNMLNRYGKCMENSGRGFYTLLILFHPITIKLTNRFVLCFLKNSLRVLYIFNAVLNFCYFSYFRLWTYKLFKFFYFNFGGPELKVLVMLASSWNVYFILIIRIKYTFQEGAILVTYSNSFKRKET